MAPIFQKDTTTDKKINTLIKDIRAKRAEFDQTSSKLVRHIEHDIELEKHFHNETDHDITLNMARGLSNVVSSAEGIVFPEDLE